MNIYVILWLMGGALILTIAALIFFAKFDFRAWVVKRYGQNYKHGLAHIKYNDVWVYRESELIYEDDRAMSYIRRTMIDGKPCYVTDIVPNDIGFTYDEYTGARVYRIAPGGSVATSDDGNAPTVDYPARLVSSHILDRTAVTHAASIKDGKREPINGWLIAGVIALVAVIIILFVSGVIPSPWTKQAAPAVTENQTTTQMTPGIPPNGTVQPITGGVINE